MTPELEFICNVCGERNRRPVDQLGREQVSCSLCQSSGRVRALLLALSRELFGLPMTVRDFPRVKSLRGLGISDSAIYADRLSEKLDYRNTYYDRDPRFDVLELPESEIGRYDCVISSEVFEHVAPPVERVFHNIVRLLKPGGVLVFTVPYSLDESTVEHFPGLHEWGLARVGDRMMLVNRDREGRVQTFDNLAFHIGFGQPALEMRLFSESDLRAMLQSAGFTDVQVHGEEYRPYGVVPEFPCSLPISARKGPFAFSRDSAREVLEQWEDLSRKFHVEMKKLGKSYWFRIGRKLRLL